MELPEEQKMSGSISWRACNYTRLASAGQHEGVLEGH